MINIYTPKKLSERTGEAFANLAVLDMLHQPDRAIRTEILQAALLDLQRLPHPVEAAAGFADGLVEMLEIGFDRAKRNEKLFFGGAEKLPPAQMQARGKPTKAAKATMTRKPATSLLS